MRRLKLASAGESHGPLEIAILSGIPAGLPLLEEQVDRDLGRRQRGYGRGGRQQIEQDRVRFQAGVRRGVTTGAPLALLVENRDHANWSATMGSAPSAEPDPRPVTVPRPGHADLSGMAKYGFADARDVLERSSARETVSRVAAGAVAKALLASLGTRIAGRVVAIGGIADEHSVDLLDPLSIDWEQVEASDLGLASPGLEERVRARIDEARAVGVSLGGIFEIWAWDLCPGLGGYATMQERLDGRLGGALLGIPAVKGVEFGAGFAVAAASGDEVHDALYPDSVGGVRRRTNRAGGLEGGMTNGAPLVVRAAMKPIPTMTSPLPSIDVNTRASASAHRERSDVEAVPAARVVGEAMVALILADAYLEKFGGDRLVDTLAALEHYRLRVEERGLWPRS